MPSPNRTKTEFFNGTYSLGSDTIKVALYNDTTAFTFDSDVHEFVDDVLDGGTTAEEFGGAGGTGYSRKTLSSTAVTQDDADDEAVFDAADLSWSSLDGETIQGVIVYRQVGGDDTTPGDDDVLFLIDDAHAQSLPIATNGSQIDLNWATEGIATLA